MALPKATLGEEESQEYFLEEVAAALGRQHRPSDQAKGQSAGVLGVVQRGLGALQGRAEPSTVGGRV